MELCESVGELSGSSEHILLRIFSQKPICIRFSTEESLSLCFLKLKILLTSAVFVHDSVCLSANSTKEHSSKMIDSFRKLKDNINLAALIVFFSLDNNTCDHTPTLQISHHSFGYSHRIPIDLICNFNNNELMHRALCTKLSSFLDSYHRALLFLWREVKFPPKTLLSYHYVVRSSMYSMRLPWRIEETREEIWRKIIHENNKQKLSSISIVDKTECKDNDKQFTDIKKQAENQLSKMVMNVHVNQPSSLSICKNLNETLSRFIHRDHHVKSEKSSKDHCSLNTNIRLYPSSDDIVNGVCAALEFSLPLDTPLVRRGQALHPVPRIVTWLGPSSELLVCPHEAVKQAPNIGQTYIVTGRYTYKHYLQDGVDDRNWGCAYRSLQTLVSWLMWQGEITPGPIPSLRDIQASIVRFGDKPKSFIGSCQWIGSLEPSENRSSSSDSAVGVWVWAYHNVFTMCGIVLGFEP
uniref:Ufm1-specific protease 2 n=1 Tax=Schistosoma haematobium TaxID=6185 RepID=A0A095CD54_SCHHA